MFGHRGSIRAVVIAVPVAVMIAVVVVAAGLVLALPTAQGQGIAPRYHAITRAYVSHGMANAALSRGIRATTQQAADKRLTRRKEHA